MSLRAESPARTAGIAGPAGLARVRQASLVALVLVVVSNAATIYLVRPPGPHGG
jgi:hypothetical protein